MMSCKKVSELMSSSLDRPLSLSERLGVFTHSLICKGCTHYKQQMLFIRAASQRIAEQSDANNDGHRLSQEAISRIKHKIGNNRL